MTSHEAPFGAPVAPRDWISVDDSLRHLLDAAPDQDEKDALRLAADACGGPDPLIAGGGAAWREALAAAREELVHAAKVELDASEGPGGRCELTESFAAARDKLAALGLGPEAETRVLGLLTELAGDVMVEARRTERAAVVRWLRNRAAKLGERGSLGIRAQALRRAADRLADTQIA